MVDKVIDLDDPRTADLNTALQQTLLCWDDKQMRDLALKLKDYDLVLRPETVEEMIDKCGNGKGIYMLTKPKMAWKKFPVYYHIDPIGCNEPNKPAVIAAVKAAFESYNKVMGKQAFVQTTDRANAKIKVYWAIHDGREGQLAVCNYQYYPTRGEMIGATIKFDQTDQWFINPQLTCGYVPGPFDLQHTAAHEVGHALGLAHVYDDPDSTLYPMVRRGETKGRSLDLGTVKAIKDLYGL